MPSLDNITICYFITKGQFFHAELHLTIHKTTSCQHILFQKVGFLKPPEDICHFEAPDCMMCSCTKVLFSI